MPECKKTKEGDIIDLAQQYNAIEKSGAWFAFEGERLGQGRDNTRLFLKEHPEILEKIRKKIEAKAIKDGGLLLAGGLATPNEETPAAAEEDENGAGSPKDSVRDKAPRNPGLRPHSKKGD